MKKLETTKKYQNILTFLQFNFKEAKPLNRESIRKEFGIGAQFFTTIIRLGYMIKENRGVDYKFIYNEEITESFAEDIRKEVNLDIWTHSKENPKMNKSEIKMKEFLIEWANGGVISQMRDTTFKNIPGRIGRALQELGWGIKKEKGGTKAQVVPVENLDIELITSPKSIKELRKVTKRMENEPPIDIKIFRKKMDSIESPKNVSINSPIVLPETETSLTEKEISEKLENIIKKNVNDIFGDYIKKRTEEKLKEHEKEIEEVINNSIKMILS
jgi:hypothetical protein